MAAQILSGTGGVSYTNSTGQNVRIIINYMIVYRSATSMSWTGDNGTAELRPNNNATIGKELAYVVRGKEQTDSTSGSSKVITTNHGQRVSITSGGAVLGSAENLGGMPTEIALGPGYTFSTSPTGKYNITIIPEAG